MFYTFKNFNKNKTYEVQSAKCIRHVKHLKTDKYMCLNKRRNLNRI